MADIADMTMETYKKRICEDTGPGLVQPKIPATANFKLKGHILFALKDISFYGNIMKMHTNTSRKSMTLLIISIFLIYEEKQCC